MSHNALEPKRDRGPAEAQPSPVVLGAVPIVRHLDALRDSLDITVPELARLIGNDRTHLWRVLQGQVTATPDLISRCLIALGRKAKHPKPDRT